MYYLTIFSLKSYNEL